MYIWLISLWMCVYLLDLLFLKAEGPHAALAAAKNAQLTHPCGLQQVGQEEVVARAVDRMRRHRDEQELTRLAGLQNIAIHLYMYQFRSVRGGAPPYCW